MAIDPATLKLRYPAFAARDDATIQYWLDDAARIVTPDWSEREPATLALAAHGMAVQGLDQTGAVAIPAGVTSFRSGAFSVSLTEAAANRSLTASYGSTRYGVEFQAMLRRKRGGPLLASFCAG